MHDDSELGHDDLIGPPYHIVVGGNACYQCGAPHDVAAIVGTFHGDARCFALYIRELPDQLLEAVREHVEIEESFSKTAGHAYYANHCPQCNALCGDHYLHRPGAIFAPLEPEEATKLRVIEVGPSVSGHMHASSAYGTSLEWILEFA